jgi:hypothetical protein
MRRLRWGAAALVSAAAMSGQAAGIYRCEADGVKTFVDSPLRCPGGRATPFDDKSREEAASPAARRLEALGAAGRGEPIRATRAVASSPDIEAPKKEGPVGVVSTACAKIQDATTLRQCLRDERRAEVRRIATERLAALSRAVKDYAGSPRRHDGDLAIDKKARSVTWCQDLLNDVMTLKNLDVVDDEEVASPKWGKIVDAGGRRVPSIVGLLDSGFKQWNVDGERVASGYVTMRWRGPDPITLRLVAACLETDGKVRCNALRHTSLFVYEGVAPIACSVNFIGKPYWPAWRDSMTPIRLVVPR